MSEELGVGVKRSEDFSRWYLEVVRKGGFVDQRSPVKGFDVITPWGYAVWEFVQKKFDSLIKKNGVVNAYFPLLFPESLVKKEEGHFQGFRAETFIVTEAGGEPLEERLAIRPTSETVMYYMYSLWIRSHKDLPLKINQWNNVLRFDTKATKPFIRGREFLWQEGHTAHASREDAEKWIATTIKMYSDIYDMLGLSALVLVRPESDTFAGADYSVVFDTVVQDGRVVQGPDAHMLGQNFSKAFGIKFLDEKGQEQYVWQTSWGMSTRQIGIVIMHHGDDAGAVLPPAAAPVQVVIVPVLFKGKEKSVLKACADAKEKLEKMGVRVHLDDRDYSAGFKFSDWELKGVPLRLEIGPKDVAKKQAVAVRRTDGKKAAVKMSKMGDVEKMLDSIQNEMLKKSEAFLKNRIADVTSLEDLANITGFARINWCGSAECEKAIKAETGGCEIRGILYGKKEKALGQCIYCGKKAEHVAYAAKAY